MADIANRFNSKSGVFLEEGVKYLRDTVPELRRSPYFPFLDLARDHSIYDLPELKGPLFLAKKEVLGECWEERFGSIQQGRLRIYMNQTDVQPRNFLNFEVTTCTIKVTRGCIFTLQASESSKVQKFVTATREEFYEWALALYCFYFRSTGCQAILNTVVSIPQYWKKSFITFEQIMKEAETCDLILFAGRNIGALAVRLFTRSDYDHVAMLIREENGKLYVVESLSGTGVQILEFNDQLIFSWFESHKTLSFRKLECKRNEAFNKRVIDKTVEWCGFPFKLGFRELIRHSSAENPQTFFCSELIAALYQSLGFIRKDSPINQYWPSCFGPSKNIDLKGARLSEVSYVVFNDSS